MRVSVMLLPAMFVITAVHAQEQSQVPKMILKELQGMVGAWEIKGRVADEKVTGTWRAQWAPGKHCLMRHSTRPDGDREIVGIGVIGWDAATETITEQVFFSDKGSALLRWKVQSPGKWEGVITGFQNGGKSESKAMLTKKGPNEFLYEEKAADGKETEVVLRKVQEEKEKKPAPKTGVPEAALNELKYRVGKWESVGYTDGKKQEDLGVETTEWADGQYATRVKGSWVEGGARFYASGLIGWDADKKQLVEQWYVSDGGRATFRYNLDQKDVWDGSFTWVYGDGRKYEGKSVVEKKSNDEWEWNASYAADGKEHTWRTVNRRVKGK